VKRRVADRSVGSNEQDFAGVTRRCRRVGARDFPGKESGNSEPLFARRARRLTSIPAESTTRLAMPCPVSQRCSQSARAKARCHLPPMLRCASCVGTRVASDISTRCEGASRCRFECNGEIARSRRRIGLRHEGNVVTLHRFHEAFRHSVALRAAYGRVQWLQSEDAAKLRVLSAVQFEPLSVSHLISAGAFRTLPKRFSTAASMTSRATSPLCPSGRGRPAHRFTATAIQREGDTQRLAVIASKLKAVRAPALVALGYRNLAVMSSLRAWRPCSAL
jgi:hypothetical protein